MQSDKEYYIDYKKRLDAFLMAESLNITVREYMKLVEEIEITKELITRL